MKTILLLPLLMAAPVFAGTSAKQTIAPAPNPCLTSWFTGASAGYLTESEEMMYNFHVGVTNSCWTVAGWNIALFAEVGYTDQDSSYSFLGPISNDVRPVVTVDTDLTIVPITFNIKFERAIAGNLNAYLGAGLGAAWMGADVNLKINNVNVASASDSDWVFTAQVFGGLSYKFTPNCEMYGGARWIYYANPSFADTAVTVSDDCLLELGARYTF